jgi:hypothetical protein
VRRDARGALLRRDAVHLSGQAKAAGSGRLGEHLVQDLGALLRLGYEAAVVAGELDYGGAEPVRAGHGATVGELALRGGPGGDHDPAKPVLSIGEPIMSSSGPAPCRW